MKTTDCPEAITYLRTNCLMENSQITAAKTALNDAEWLIRLDPKHAKFRLGIVRQILSFTPEEVADILKGWQ